MNPEWLLTNKYANPRTVQLEALHRSYGHSGWCHYLEMRLGKSAVNLAEFALYRRDHGFKWLIIISPNSFKYDWVMEAEASGLGIPAMALESSKRGVLEAFIRKNHEGIVVVNYEAVRSKENMVILYSLCGPHTMITADESILIKNPSSIIAKHSIELAKQCGIRRALTGKPVTQGASDLWTQLRFVGAISGINYVAFRNRYCVMGGFQGKQMMGIKNEEDLHGLLDTCSWTARRVDWLTTPGRDYMSANIEMLPEQKKLYDEMDNELIVNLNNGTIVSSDQIITKLMKMSQISSGFIIDEEGKTHELVPLENNPKIKYVMELLENGLTTKLVIFYHYKASGAALRLALSKYNPAWIGSPTLSPIEEKEKFTNDATCRVMLAQTKAAKYGHNLMASKNDPCHTSIFYENTYSLDDRSQCEERNQGEGQSCPVTLIDFIAAKRDQVVIESLRRKEDVAATILRYARETGVLPKAAVTS